MKPACRIAIFAALIALTACGGGHDPNRLGFNGPHMVGSPFSKYLAREYRDLSNSAHTSLFSRIFGSIDARRHFARKSAAAADGVIVVPEMPGDWALNGADFAELSQARADLMGVLDNGGRDLVPDKAALAQAQFDCWVTGQERTRNNDSLCKSKFEKTLHALQSSLDHGSAPTGYAASTGAVGAPSPASSATDAFPAPITSAAAGTVSGAGAEWAGAGAGTGAGSGSGAASAAKGTLAPVQQAMFIVFFDWDKAALSGSANDVMDAIAEELKARQDVKKISVTGHADTSGGEKYNQTLSLRRAHAVRDALAARGAPAEKISAEGRGEGDLLVRTPDNVREPGNRRVQITLE